MRCEVGHTVQRASHASLSHLFWMEKTGKRGKEREKRTDEARPLISVPRALRGLCCEENECVV